MIEAFKAGGILMYPLALCSIVAMAIILERAFNLRRRKIIRPEIIQVIENIKGPEDLGLAYSICEKNPGPFSNLTLAALEMKDLPKEEIKEAITDSGRQETRFLERGLVLLDTIATIAPLLGILGTVLGMIMIFQAITEFGTGQANALASGIQVALITTAAGLFIAIPTLTAHNYYAHKVEGFVLELEYWAGVLMTKLQSFQAVARNTETYKEVTD